MCTFVEFMVQYAVMNYCINFHDKWIPSKDIYSIGCRITDNAFAKPSYEYACVKILDYVAEHGPCSKDNALDNLFDGSNFDSFHTLVNYGFLEYVVNAKSKRNKLFVITDLGLQMLKDAKDTKMACVLYEFVKKNCIGNLAEFMIRFSLAFGDIDDLKTDIKQSFDCCRKRVLKRTENMLHGFTEWLNA